jgi:glycerol transport system ATP-binding protein
MMNLVAENLSYKPDEQFHLNEVSFNFKKGNIYTILGRTLSGKTTLLKTIAGLLTPDSGAMHFEDKDFLKVPVWERNIAMVYQQFINYPHLNVFENVAFPLKQRKVDDKEISDVVLNSLKSVGLEGYENRKIQELSGGQQQRVSLARSLVKNAKILLLDEPLVNLDYKLREQLREEFKNIFSQGLSEESIVIFSTTDPREAMELNGEVIVLDEGKVLQVGPAKEIFENPKTLKVAEISNDPPMNILQANMDSNKIKFEGIEVDVPNHLINVKDKNFNLGIRASNIELSDNGFEFEVELAEISGSETLLHLKRGNAKIITSIEEVMNFNIHDKVKLNFNIDKVYAFNEEGILASSPFGGSYV